MTGEVENTQTMLLNMVAFLKNKSHSCVHLWLPLWVNNHVRLYECVCGQYPDILLSVTSCIRESAQKLL